MARQSFNEAIEYAPRMCLTDPSGTKYEGFYADPKIDRSTLPEGWYCYDFRHDDDGCGFFCTLEENYVIVNNAGCFFTQNEIPDLKEPRSWIGFAVDPVEWEMLHTDDDDDGYECPECPERLDSDWEWTFC